MQTLGVSLETLAVQAMPVFDGRCRPRCRFIDMAVIAGIRRTVFDGQVRARDAETMIMPAIDDHVGSRRHVARAAGEPLQSLVAMVGNSCILVSRVTL